MSLELALAENTAALKELINALKQGIPTTAAQVAAVVEEAKAPAKKEKPKAEPKTVEPVPIATAPATGSEAVTTSNPASPAPVAEPAASPEPTSAAPSGSVVDFETLKTAFLAMVNSNRVLALDVLAKFNLAKLSEAKADQYAAILAAIQGA